MSDFKSPLFSSTRRFQAGDKIVKIGNKPVNGMSLEDGVKLMRHLIYE
jgi:C-terminal processing protease CtpA/Prc